MGTLNIFKQSRWRREVSLGGIWQGTVVWRRKDSTANSSQWPHLLPSLGTDRSHTAKASSLLRRGSVSNPTVSLTSEVVTRCHLDKNGPYTLIYVRNKNKKWMAMELCACIWQLVCYVIVQSLVFMYYIKGYHQQNNIPELVKVILKIK